MKRKGWKLDAAKRHYYEQRAAALTERRNKRQADEQRQLEHTLHMHLMELQKTVVKVLERERCVPLPPTLWTWVKTLSWPRANGMTYTHRNTPR